MKMKKRTSTRCGTVRMPGWGALCRAEPGLQGLSRNARMSYAEGTNNAQQTFLVEGYSSSASSSSDESEEDEEER